MTEVAVVQLLVSPAHRLAGRPADGPAAGPDDERVERVEVRSGLGLVGDRYYGRPAHRDASVTIMSAENLRGTSTRPPICGTPGATSCSAASTSTPSSAPRSPWTAVPGRWSSP
jgi:hypothetical protein